MKDGVSLAAVILARMDSTRLPGKVLADIGGVPLVQFIRHRLERVSDLKKIVLATTARPCDDILADSFASAGGEVHRCQPDDLNDVASRFVAAADSVGADYALRVNGDSPFPSPALIGEAARMLATLPDFVTNLLPRSYPYGVSIEWVRVAALRAALPGLDARCREHLTRVFYERSGNYRILSLPTRDPSLAHLCLTIDEPTDLEAARDLVVRLGGISAAERADLPEILAILDPVGGLARSTGRDAPLS